MWNGAFSTNVNRDLAAAYAPHTEASLKKSLGVKSLKIYTYDELMAKYGVTK